MAGFLDKIMEFNPYISQTPVEDYLRVGMQKQAQYNQGIEKVQSHIDSVAGLEIVKDVHKQYLNSALSNLQEKVKKVASADFSNAQLVNQIGGASRQIINDPILTNAVSSTMFAKKQMTQMEEDRKAGKLNPANEYDFQAKYSKWLTDGDARTSFNSIYTPYRDVNKKLLEGFKTLMPSSNITDLPFKMDGSGNIVRDNAGNPILNEVAIRQQYKGISAKTIQDMMKSILDESDLEQLRMSGKYQYRNITPDMMESQIKNSFDNSLRDLSKARETLVAQKLVAKSENQEQIQASIEAIDKELENVQTQISNSGSVIQRMKDDPEGYKGDKFINDYFKNFISAYAYSETEAKYIPNEYQEYRMKREKLDLDYNKFAYEQSRDLVADEKWMKEYELSLAKERREAGNPLGEGVPVFEGTKSTDVVSSYKRLNEEIKNQEGQLSALNNGIVNSSPILQDVSPQVQAKALEMLYSDFLSNGEMTNDPFVNQYLTQRKDLEYDIAVNKNLANNAKLAGEAGMAEASVSVWDRVLTSVGRGAAPKGSVPETTKSSLLQSAKSDAFYKNASEHINERTNRYLPQYSSLSTDEKSTKYWQGQVLAKLNSGAVGQDAEKIRKAVTSGKGKISLREDQDTKTSSLIVTDEKGTEFAPISLSSQEAQAQGFGKFSPAMEVKNIIYANRPGQSKIGTTNISNSALGAGFDSRHMPYVTNPKYKSLVRADIEGSDEMGGYVPKVWIKNPNSQNNNKWVLKTLSEVPIPLEDAMKRIQMINDAAIEAELNK